MAPTSEDKVRQRLKPEEFAKKPTKAKKKEIDEIKRNKFATAHAELQAATGTKTHRIWTRTVIILSVMTLVYFYTKNQNREVNFALVRENLPLRMQKFKCHWRTFLSSDDNEFPQCVPRKCGRFVADQTVDKIEVETLLDLARRIFDKAGSSGSASILDLHTGAVSYGANFANVFQLPTLAAEFEEKHLEVYKLVKDKIKLSIIEQFGISSELYLTYPTFFARLTNVTAKTKHDEYWHEHIDKETYPSFHYTSLLYLNTHGKDFTGGRFIFVDGDSNNPTTSSIMPKAGRLSAFTSGAENRHYVEQVTAGERFAVTISFTCDDKKAIADPQIKARDGDPKFQKHLPKANKEKRAA